MRFLKKNLIYIIITAACFALLAVPGLKEKIRDHFFPIAAVKDAVTIPDADYNIDLKGINTPDTNLKNFKNKPLFLNFWGTWCPPCRSEWPSIQKLYDAKKGQVNFVLIAMQDKEEDVREFLKKNNYTVPVYIAHSPISEKLLPKSFPTTFLLHPSGQILLKEEYATDWYSAETLKFISNSVK